jgi:hypothetical protein
MKEMLLGCGSGARRGSDGNDDINKPLLFDRDWDRDSFKE